MGDAGIGHGRDVHLLASSETTQGLGLRVCDPARGNRRASFDAGRGFFGLRPSG